MGTERNFNVRSLEFTTLFMIKREDFVNVLKHYNDDYEKFCLIKDEMLVYNNF